MIFENKTSFTSEPVENAHEPILELYVTITGPGPVAIEQLEEDGTWRTFPELTFDGPKAVIATVKRGYWRVSVTGGPTTVEVRDR